MRCTKQCDVAVVQGQRCVNVCVCQATDSASGKQAGGEFEPSWKGVRRLPAWQLRQCASHGLTPAAAVSAAALSAAAASAAAASVSAAQVATLIARAHHDATEHMAARRALARGMHMFPTDLKLRFNMAFVLQVGASQRCACGPGRGRGMFVVLWAVRLVVGCKGGGKGTGQGGNSVFGVLVSLLVLTPSSCICALHAVTRAD